MVGISPSLRALGENLKYLQMRENVTRECFVQKLGYDRVDYGKLLWGEKNIRLSTAERLAARTGFALSALVDTSFTDDAGYRNRYLYKEINTLSVFLQAVNHQMSLKRITMSDISQSLEMDKAELSRILNGQIKNPTLKTLDRISSAIGCRLSELLREGPK